MWLHQAAGEANESQGLLDEAIGYRQVLTLAPGRPGIHFRIGRGCSRARPQGNGDVAAERFPKRRRPFEQELPRIDPTNANAAYELGEMQRKSRPARNDAHPVLRARGGGIIPTSRRRWSASRERLIALDRPADALPHLKTALELEPRRRALRSST